MQFSPLLARLNKELFKLENGSISANFFYSTKPKLIQAFSGIQLQISPAFLKINKIISTKTSLGSIRLEANFLGLLPSLSISAT